MNKKKSHFSKYFIIQNNNFPNGIRKLSKYAITKYVYVQHYVSLSPVSYKTKSHVCLQLQLSTRRLSKYAITKYAYVQQSNKFASTFMYNKITLCRNKVCFQLHSSCNSDKIQLKSQKMSSLSFSRDIS